MIRRLLAWLVGPVMRGPPPAAGSRVVLSSYHPTVPVGTVGLVLRGLPPGRGVVVRWENGETTVAFAAELSVTE